MKRLSPQHYLDFTMLKRVAVALFVVLLSTQTAEACLRCGLFGRRCAFVQKQVVVKKQAVSYAYQQPSNTTNLSLINVYPAASSTYGVSQLYQAYQVNPTLSLELSSRLADKALSNHEASIRLAQEHNSQSLELQRLQLATMHLQAAMGTGQQSSASSSLQLNVTQGAGAVQQRQPLGGEELPPPRPGSLLSVKCAQCHGQSLQAPKAGLYIDEGISLDATQAMRAMQILTGHDVPEQMHDLITGLTQQERCDLMAEITQLWRQ